MNKNVFKKTVKHVFNCFFCLFFLLYCQVINAEISPLKQSLAIGTSNTKVNLSEHDQARRINQEQGYLKGLRSLYKVDSGRLSASFEIEQSTGQLDYLGKSQLGKVSTTSTNFSDHSYGVTLAYQPEFINHLFDKYYQAFSLVVGAENRVQIRNILSQDNISGLNERYSYVNLNFGARWHLQLNQRYALSLALERSAAVAANLKVNFLGLFDDSKVELNNVVTHLVSTKLSYQVNRNWQVHLGYLFQHLDIPKSESTNLTLANEQKGYFHQPERLGLFDKGELVFSYVF